MTVGQTVRVLSLPVSTHGRVHVEDAAEVVSGAGILVAFHGYGQSAEDMLDAVRRISGASAWTIVSVQGLHRFYTRDNQRVVASWMTRQDREAAIADNVAYVDRALDVAVGAVARPVVFIGFSQGVATAWRAAMLGAREPAGVITLAGDIPPELKAEGAVSRAWPRALVATGARDTWFTRARLEEDAAFLRSRGVEVEALTFDGGHEWTDEFRAAAGQWLMNIRSKDGP